MKQAQIVKEIGNFDPNYVYGTGNQPVHALLIEIDENGDPASMKLSDGIRQYDLLKNLIDQITEATDIVQDSTHRFVTDSQIGNWNDKVDVTALTNALSSKQDTLVSGTTLKTVNGTSLLGSGNILISGGSSVWADITGKPTTLSGYGITDAQSKLVGTTDQYVRGDGSVASALFYADTNLFQGDGTDNTTNLFTLKTIPVNKGGTGATTLTGLLLGNGTNAVTAITTSAALLAAITDETGTGSLVFASSPTLVTPILGVATATSINKVNITAPATAATLTIANNATLQTTGAFTINLTATANSTPTFPTGTGTLAYTAGTNNWTGINTITRTGLTTTTVEGLQLTNTTAATSGTALQNSPGLRFSGRVWNTTATAASNQYDFLELATATSGAVPVSTLSWYSSLVTGTTPTYTQRMTLDNSGNLKLITGDVEIIDATKGIIIKSPNATRWRITVTNAGVLTAVSL